MGWISDLLPASFRGVPFYVEDHRTTEGRRVAPFEFPDRDNGYTEDLGRRLTRYRFRAFIMGPNYDATRDALRSACRDVATPGTLVHPYFGVLTVCCETIQTREERLVGGAAEFILTFIEAGAGASPVSVADPAAGLIDGATSILSLVAVSFAALWNAAAVPLAAGAAVLTGWSGGFLGSLSGLSTVVLNGFLPQVAAVTAAPADADATSSAVAALFSAAGAAVAAAQAVSTTAPDPVLGAPPPAVAPADPSYGLIGSTVWGQPASITTLTDSAPAAVLPSFAAGSWGAALAPISTATPIGAASAANQQAALDLIAGTAVAILATVFAQAPWPTSNAAAAAQAQLVALIDQRCEAASNAGQDALYAGWLGFASLAAQYMIAEAQQLPSLGPYAVNASLPALALAQRLYADHADVDTDAAELVALNACRHPLFMPQSGVQLVQ